MADQTCPVCSRPVPADAPNCGSCGYAGLMAPKGRMRLLNTSGWAGRAVTVMAFGMILLVRCGGQVITHADDVANVADLVGGVTDDGGADQGDDEPLPGSDVIDEPGFNYVSSDGSFAATFPDAAIDAEISTTLEDGTEVLTIHHGDWHVRRLLVLSENDVGGTAELHALAKAFSEGAGATLVQEEELDATSEQFRTSDGEREMDGVVLTGNQAGSVHAYYLLWHSPPAGAPADVGPLWNRFRWT